jgi:ComF family protein
MNGQIKDFLRTVSHLTFPEKCLHCELELLEKELFICSFCKSNFSYTYFENLNEPSAIDKLFWGRVPILATYSLLNFEENSSTQKILYALKYKNNRQIGKYYGREIGEKLKNLSPFDTLEALIPVPIHPKKRFQRGYNQAEIIARGIGEQLLIPIVEQGILKTKHTISQTRKSMWERWQNSENVFASNQSLSHFQHVALVDDVLTTGATIERLANVLLKNNPELKISIITLAIAK